MQKKQTSLLDFVQLFSSSEDEEEEEIKNQKSNIRMDDSLEEEGVTLPKETEQEFDITLKETKFETGKKKQKKNEIIGLILQLRTHIKAMEKEKKSSFYSKRFEKQNPSLEYDELKNIEINSTKKFNQDRTKVKEQLEKITLKVNKFQREKDSIQKCAQYLEKLKTSMEDIESHIMQFKEKQRLTYEEICFEEKELSEELQNYDKKFDQWSKHSYQNKILQSKCEINKEKYDNMPKEVADFEMFLSKTGGYQGGWDDIDHQIFLKYRRQYQNDDKLLLQAVNEIPTKSYEEIKHHICWYKEFVELKEGKREAIRIWKHSKENERQGLLTNAEEDLLNNKSMIKRREKLNEKDREKRFKQLQQWKLSKENEKQVHMNVDEEEKEKRKLKEIIEERKKCELKLKVEEYKQRKQEEELILQQAMEEQSKRSKVYIPQEELARIKERNEKLIAVKKEQALAKQFEQEEKERRLEKLKQNVVVKVRRDPARLYKLTEGLKHRKDQSDTSVGNSVGTHTRLLPHKAIPSWRQGLS